MGCLLRLFYFVIYLSWVMSRHSVLPKISKVDITAVTVPSPSRIKQGVLKLLAIIAFGSENLSDVNRHIRYTLEPNERSSIASGRNNSPSRASCCPVVLAPALAETSRTYCDRCSLCCLSKRPHHRNSVHGPSLVTKPDKNKIFSAAIVLNFSYLFPAPFFIAFMPSGAHHHQ